MLTYMQKPLDVQEKWYLVNAEGKTLGRLAARVAGVLRGKHRPTFTPHVDMGDRECGKDPSDRQQNGHETLSPS
jgi:large subunit ribosomal protein L13